MKKIIILGSSGSIGRQTLEIVQSHPDEMRVFGLSVKTNTELLVEQARAFHPRYAASETAFDTSLLPIDTEAMIGVDAAEKLAGMSEADVVVNGISGFSALLPLLASLKAGKRVALANKESVVCGSMLADDALARFGGELLPVDSEQSAIFQCLQNGRRDEVEKLVLTASGGPFWRMPFEELEHITVERALQHPTWSMGRKITIDSATLFNKGLEVIEAAYLFHLPAEKIGVVIHPQSIVHSMVAYIDGTTMANMSFPDMRLPIQYAITYPARIPSICRPLSLPDTGDLSFHAVDLTRFRAVGLAYEALRAGMTYPTVYNGANEAAVEAFCGGRIGFLDITRAVDYTLQQHEPCVPDTVEAVFAADDAARRAVEAYITAMTQKRGI